MHLQQSKLESRATGGPQYWIQSAPGYITEYLRRRRACPVVLQTPYGITWSQFVAVHRDWKLVGRKIVSANAQHDRIQQGSATRSIGEEIRYWYGVKEGQDFERIDVDVQIYDKIQQEEHFILIPTKVKMRGRARPRDLERVIAPLSFHHKYQSPFWRGHLDARRSHSSADLTWAAAQINRVVAEHAHKQQKGILECDLLRTAGALSLLGLDLSPYLGEGYDCLNSTFQFGGFPVYPCPVEVKTRSKSFNYQMAKYTRLPRAVVLCMEHNLVNPPEHIDVIELPELGKYLGGA